MTNGEVIKRLRAIIAEENAIHAEVNALKKKLKKGFGTYEREQDISYLDYHLHMSLNNAKRELFMQAQSLGAHPEHAECDPHWQNVIRRAEERCEELRRDYKMIAGKYGIG